MSNEEIYATGVLNRALDPATQPPEIRAFMTAEIDLLHELVRDGMSVLDVGCGTGRHLRLLSETVRIGVGIDSERRYLVEARHRTGGQCPLHFVAGDATRMPVGPHFDFAMCITNSWGTMSDKRGVLGEMRRCAPRPRTRLLSVFSESSVEARREWYRRFDEPVVDAADDYLVTRGGLRSEHFTQERLRSLVGECAIRPLAGIAYVVTF